MKEFEVAFISREKIARSPPDGSVSRQKPNQ